MCNYINRPAKAPLMILVGQGPETLPILTRIALGPLKTRKAQSTIRIDVKTLQASRHVDDDLGYTIETGIEARTAINEPTHLEIIVHSILAGKEQAIWAAIQDSCIGTNDISEDLGSLPSDETIARRIIEDIYENYATQQKILKLARRFDTGELLGTMTYRAHPIIGNYESVEIEASHTACESDVHKVIIAPKQVGVHPLQTAALVVPMDIPLGGQISRTFTRRWLSSIIDPEPIKHPDEFAEDLIQYWKEYRRNINEKIRQRRMIPLDRKSVV